MHWRTVFLFNTPFSRKRKLFFFVIISLFFYQSPYAVLKAKNPGKIIKDIQGFALITGNYQRIVTLSPNMTEICLALGLKDRLVGVCVFNNFIRIKNAERIDGWNINYERILVLKPDLVLTTSAGNPPQVIGRLRELGLNVFHTEQACLEEIFETIRKIGELTETRRNAETTISTMKKELMEIENRLPSMNTKPRVLYLLWTAPPMAPGGGTFLSEMISLAGGKNIFGFSRARIVKPSLEKIIKLDPEIIFLPQDVDLSDLDERWTSITAVKNRNVFHVNEDFVLRPGINTVKGIEELAARINSNEIKDKR
jgi:ABC-type Fe3+-hydroxamate transport system substrate-binding protein